MAEDKTSDPTSPSQASCPSQASSPSQASGDENRPQNPARRLLVGSGAALLGAHLLPDLANAQPAKSASRPAVSVAPERPPAGYNILFILVDQEHYFEKWPFPVPAREWLKANGISFANHQAASCVCSPARSTIYTGLHIPHTGVFDNANSPWQADMATSIKTIGHRLAQLGYHAAYQGKWHLSYNLDKAKHADEAPMAEYRKTMESYGFQDFFGFGDITDTTLGGYDYDATTSAFVERWMRTKGLKLKESGTPWYLAVNFVNPHDVMYVNSDMPGETVQGRKSAMAIARPPDDDIYAAKWDAPLPSTRSQPFDAPGRPPAHLIYQDVQDTLVGAWPDEDRRWRVLRDYYFNCIRDCDRQVDTVLTALRQTGMDENTIIVFTADHGELGGAHQMRGKGNSTYREQNHLPLIVVHPAYPGGASCQAVTSQVDLTPTLLALTGLTADQLKAAGEGLAGRDFSPLLKAPAKAAPETLRPGALFCYDMLLFQDAKWITRMEAITRSPDATGAQKRAWLEQYEPDFAQRCAIRSLFDGRYRFSRYFAPLTFNTPATYEDLLALNDLELYDLREDPEEKRNLAHQGANRDLVMAMNAKLNARIAEEVGLDDGSFLPLKDGKWVLPRADQR